MKIKSISLKIWTIIITGVVAIVLIISFSYFAKKYYANTTNILNDLIVLKNYDNKLKYYVLHSDLFLYSDNDNITNTIHHIRNLIKRLKKNTFFKEYYNNSYKEFLNYTKKFQKTENDVFEFLRYNLPLKNSLMYLLNSVNLSNFNNKEYKNVLKTISLILLYNNSLDKDFYNKIKVNKQYTGKDSYKIAFYKNLEVYLEYLPKQKHYLNKILHSGLNSIINNTIKEFKYKLNNDLKLFEFLSYLLVSFIIVILMLLIFYIIKLDDKIKTITFLLEYDSLTSLKNRFSFKKDIKNFAKPVVAIFNIDKFKNINDYFGSNIGDRVLKNVGDKIKEYFREKKIKGDVYRIGADDFAFIFEGNKFDLNKIKRIIKELITYIEKSEFKFKGSGINISLSAGISNSAPFLENADIALKHIKKDFKEKIAIYDKSMNDKVYSNIKLSSEIKKIIENKKIIPYYQPIFDKDNNICKYEVLCRVLVNNKIKSIYPYLEVLKENKLYHYITSTIIKSAFEKLNANKKLELSINLSIEDILNKEIVLLIKRCFTLKKEISNRVTFEILESEISNYDVLVDFIKEMKKYGVKFAIDDFGSGYSNFNRILNLDIDYLKIDGSIVKNIVDNANSKLILETIIDFAKKAKKTTIAEFIANKEIYEKSKELGVDCFQGFYLGKPLPEIKM